MFQARGEKHWVIPDGYIPPDSTGSLTSHESVGVPYAIEVLSDIPIIVQYSRLDSTQAENTLMSTIAYPIQ
ncbi:sensory rhodopsin transducer [Paenibacillus sp. sgz302251]|uniref:sensory rhodopsin transducer n=1 Tax=Paenibacillus sp. sgz302251 TaxID=3414493 RepID=UPI003C7A7971